MSADATARDAAGFELATGRFYFGVEYEGKRHRDFVIRLPTLADNIAAAQAYPDGIGFQLELFMYARCMEKLGDIPKEAITYELLANGLLPIEAEVVADALEVVKKKLLASLNALTPSDK